MEKIKEQALYFHDMMLIDDDQVEYEIRNIQRKLNRSELELLNITETDIPPFVGGSEEKYYDILFFDYGGMSLGNSCMESFCRQIIEEARDYPNRYYIMTSSFTKDAMEDLLLYYKGEMEEIPTNIFLNVESFAEFYKKLIQQT